MLRSAVRLTAFVRKELVEVFRQPKLVLTLVLGPFAVIGAFGAGLRGFDPPVRAIVVAPAGSTVEAEVRRFADAAEEEARLAVREITADEDAALDALEAGEVDLVVVFPADAEERLRDGEQSEIAYLHSFIDPIEAQAVRILSQQAADRVNQQVLRSIIEQAQADASPLTSRVALAHGQLLVLRTSLEASGASPQQLAELATAERDLNEAVKLASQFTALAPEIVVAPFTASSRNVTAADVRLSDWYAPAAVVLLLQHMLISFIALSLVREQQLGTTELYRVAPLSPAEVLLGKTLAYGLLGGVIAAALLGLVVGVLGVPMLASIGTLAAGLAAVVFVSIAAGALIALVSQTDSQAVQYAMLVLLASIFLSGFLLSLERFTPQLQAVARALPATHGIAALRTTMLRGAPATNEIVVLSAMAAGALLLALVLLRRRLARG